MAIALQAIYDQLTSLDPAIRRIALRPVADLEVKIGSNSWQRCLYGVMAKAVARSGIMVRRRMNGDDAALLLRLPVDRMKFGDWDRSSEGQRLELRQAIKAFLGEEAKQALIQEIEALGDPLVVALATAAKKNQQSPAMARRDRVLV